MNNITKQPSIGQLLKFREKVRVELLGQTDPEYREEVRRLLIATDHKIREVQSSLAPKEALLQ